MIDLSVQVRDLSGEPVKGTTVSGLCCEALMGSLEGDHRLSGEDKLKRFLLAQRIHKTPKLALTAEEICLLKDVTGRGYTPLAVGRIWEVIDPAAVKA